MGWLRDIWDIGCDVFRRIRNAVKPPKVAPPPPAPPPPPSPLSFQVTEATKQSAEGAVHDGAFQHLVGMQKQQNMLAALSSMIWKHWRAAEEKVREERRQRVAFLVFTGGQGSGKTAHAKALADYLRIPCVLVNPGNAVFVNGEGLSTMRKVIDYCLVRKSAVILLDEIDVYAKDEGFMAEVRQFVDGASRVDDEAVVFVIGTTNKGLDIFPDDLLHRVLLEVSFDRDENESNLHPSKQNGGFSLPQCQAFWDRNAKCLNKEERKMLSQFSTGLSPRDLQLMVQKVLIATSREAMMEDKTPDTMRLPTLSDFACTLGLDRKAAAELPVWAHHFWPEPLKSTIIEATTWPPIRCDPQGSSYWVSTDDGSPGFEVRTWFDIHNKETINIVETYYETWRSSSQSTKEQFEVVKPLPSSRL